jgi:hypothetical protein
LAADSDWWMARVRAALAVVAFDCVVVRRAALRAGFLAFADFAPALVLRGEVAVVVAIGSGSPLLPRLCEEVRVCSVSIPDLLESNTCL